MAMGILGLALLVLVAVLAGQGLSASDIAVVLLAVLLLMALICGVPYLLLLFIGRVLPRLLGIELSVAVAHARRGRYTMAAEDAKRYVGRRPESPEGWLVSAGALLGMGRTEEALTAADHAVQLDEAPIMLVVRGTALYGLGLYEAACADFRSASQQPELVAGSIYGNVLTAVRSLDDAVGILSEAAASSQGFLEYVLLGDAHRLLGKSEKAATAYEEAIRRASAKQPTDGDSKAVLASCLALLGRLEEAATVSEDLLTRKPVTDSALLASALVAMVRQNGDQAYDALRRAVAASPQRALRCMADPVFAPFLGEQRFRELLAWAMGAQRQTRDHIRERFPHLFG